MKETEIKMLQVVEFTFTPEEMDLYNIIIKQQERQRVIAELEEWANEHRLRARKISEEYPTDNEEQKARLYALSSGRFDILAKLKQKPIEHDSFLLSKIDRLENKVIELQEKLNEMKGEIYENKN